LYAVVTASIEGFGLDFEATHFKEHRMTTRTAARMTVFAALAAFGLIAGCTANRVENKGTTTTAKAACSGEASCGEGKTCSKSEKCCSTDKAATCTDKAGKSN